MKDDLKDFLKVHALQESGVYQLKQGRKRALNYDLRVVFDHPVMGALAAQKMLAHVGFHTTHIGSVGAGGIAPKTLLLPMLGRPQVRGFHVAETAREHPFVRTGLNSVEAQAYVSGYVPNAASKVVLVKDIITSGDRVGAAIDILEALGVSVLRVIALIDREEGNTLALGTRNVPLHAVYRAREF